MFTKDYWRAALERAVSAAAAAASGAVVIDATNGLDLSVWKTVGTAALVGFIFSIIKGLAANATNGGSGPGVGTAEVTAPAESTPADVSAVSPEEEALSFYAAPEEGWH